MFGLEPSKVFGLTPATATNDVTNDATETREGVDVKVTPKLKTDLTKACTTLVSWVQELCRQYGWQDVKIDIRSEGPVCPLIFPNQSSTNTKAAMRAADELRSIFGIEVTK